MRRTEALALLNVALDDRAAPPPLPADRMAGALVRVLDCERPRRSRVNAELVRLIEADAPAYTPALRTRREAPASTIEAMLLGPAGPRAIGK